ncbi:hypothetical protein PY254_10475 [Rhodanobacter sp. AS-Z3]|uniref:hypothetical protein n=1 Tax=Rhodanobacter sp. AS-Z3 TaxID=3031330 RepID=UPI002478531A|nr:hypothetical protein [Rhodanobacter sp. AS-Z3]WEN13671.1 hypothetical protein PY254_10475 [Rhodanobacter sp. AS-Z3]
MPDFKPIAHATTDGRVAVYIGAGYQQLPLEAARSLATQLAIAIEQAEQAIGAVGELHG